MEYLITHIQNVQSKDSYYNFKKYLGKEYINNEYKKLDFDRKNKD